MSSSNNMLTSFRRGFLLILALWLIKKVLAFRTLLAEQTRRNHLLRKLPGPACGPESEHWLVGHVGKPGVVFQPNEPLTNWDYVSRVVVNRFQSLCKKYQDEGMVRIFALNSRIPTSLGAVVIMTNMDYVWEIVNFESSTKDWHKGKSYDISEVLIGNSVLRAFGPAWAKQRVVVEKAMHTMMANTSTVHRVLGTVDVLVQKWSKLPANTPVRVSEQALRLTMDVIGKAAFSHDFQSVSNVSGGLYGPFQVILSTLDRRCQRVHESLMTWLPTENNLKFNDSMKILNTEVQGLISARGADRDKGDLLDTLLASKEVSPELVKDNVQTMLFAGHDTTGSALTWMLRLLAEHPEHMRRLRAEILAKFGPTGSPECNEDLDRMDFLNAVVLETLRLYPSAAFTRSCDHDVTIGNKHVIPAGTEVLLMPYILHRDARYWPDRPEAFVPERFLDMEASDTMSLQSRIGRISQKQAYLPFSLGPRNCVGRALALMEMRVVLVKLLQTFEFRVPEGAEHWAENPVFSLTLNPPPEIELIPVLMV